MDLSILILVLINLVIIYMIFKEKKVTTIRGKMTALTY